MDRLTSQLRSLAADDAAATDPSPEVVERGWTRLCGALAAPAAAPVGIAAAKTIAGVLAVAVIGLSIAAAPTAIDRTPLQVEPVPATAPRALEIPTAPAVTPVATPPPPAPPSADPSPPHAKAPRAHAAVDPLVAELRTLATARAHLEAGRFRRALDAARKLLRARGSQLAPEARAIEAIAACELALPRAPDLATAYLQQHATSPHRKRVAAACKR
jgi:hypothetical protein